MVDQVNGILEGVGTEPVAPPVSTEPVTKSEVSSEPVKEEVGTEPVSNDEGAEPAAPPNEDTQPAPEASVPPDSSPEVQA